MTTDLIINKVNDALAGEILTYEDLEDLFDQVIDEINDNLNSKFPVFSELRIKNNSIPLEYTLIPDNYLRSVLVTGTAWKFFVQDEEGINTAQTYQQTYYNNLAAMVRDFSDSVPVDYQKTATGYLTATDNDDFYTGGVDINGSIWGI